MSKCIGSSSRGTSLQRTAGSTDHVPMHNKTLELECLLPTQEKKSRFYFSYRIFFEKYHIGLSSSDQNLFNRTLTCGSNKHLARSLSLRIDLKILSSTSLSQPYSPIGIPAKAPMTLLLVHFLVTPCCRCPGQVKSLLAGENTVH
jgi:hypothetical protein